jgi:hypothetical protein
MELPSPDGVGNLPKRFLTGPAFFAGEFRITYKWNMLIGAVVGT